MSLWKVEVSLPRHLEFEQWVPFPVEHVFEFFSNPENLPSLMPASAKTVLIAVNRLPASPSATVAESLKAAGIGSTIKTSFRIFPVLPFCAQWIACITEFEWNRRFVDVQAKGPFKRWRHRHEFAIEARDGMTGTLVRDAIDYEVGFGILGSIADAVAVQRRIRRTFAERQRKLSQLLR